MEFTRVSGDEIEEELLKFVFEIYRGTGGEYPRLEWLEEKPEPGDIHGFREAYAGFLHRRIVEEFDELYVLKDEKDAHILASFALVYKFEGKEIPWILKDEKCVYLEFFMVHPRVQGRGLGKEIIEFCEKRAREMGKRLCVSTFREIRAYAYYRKHGFSEIMDIGEYVILKR